jgi:UDP-N-acetylglucosamine 2-epimerase
MKVMTVFGTRPEAVKMAPLVKELAARPEFESHAALRRRPQMLDSVTGYFRIVPDFDLDIRSQVNRFTPSPPSAFLGWNRC